MPGAMTQTVPTKVCRKCKDKEARHTIRSDHFCRYVDGVLSSGLKRYNEMAQTDRTSDCFCQFVATKTVKRLEVLNRDKRNLHNGRPNGSKTFYAGLSFGTSSAALVDIMEQITMSRVSRGKEASFALHVLYIDTEVQAPTVSSPPPPAEQRLDRWRARYPRFTFERVPLVDVLALDTIDWAALQPDDDAERGGGGGGGGDVNTRRPTTADDLRALLAALPSETSRRDMLDLLVRRLLIARATASWDADATGSSSTPKCDALLLGYSTTALAERTLVETAKGRGFALPWLINDGPVNESDGRSLPLYYPVRELFRNELVQYTRACQPPLTDGDLIVDATTSSSSSSSSSAAAAAVVSHRDLSIEEVLTRYFADVEVNYPSVVANVVRTTAKLERHGHGHDIQKEGCRVCGMPLDEAGNERWKGEIGRLEGPEGRPRTGRSQLCYGCDRSIHG